MNQVQGRTPLSVAISIENFDATSSAESLENGTTGTNLLLKNPLQMSQHCGLSRKFGKIREIYENGERHA